MFAVRSSVILIADAKINAAAHSVEKAARILMMTGEAFGLSSMLVGQAGRWVTLTMTLRKSWGSAHVVSASICGGIFANCALKLLMMRETPAVFSTSPI